MAILIENMEMPKSCDSCRIMVFEDTNCVDELYCGCPIVFEAHPQGVGRRPDYCHLIEVHEPHGRMIDADALVEDLKRQCEEVFKINAVSPDDFWITRDQAYNERLWKTWCESFFEYLKTRETIIPESEEG